MTYTYTPPSLGDDPYLYNVTVTGYADGKQYSYHMNRVTAEVQSSQENEIVSSWRNDYPLRTFIPSRRSSLMLNILDPDWKLEIKEIKQVSIKHSMSMEVIGDVSTENITSFTSLLPANATWTARVEKSPYGGKDKTIFTAVWDVEPIDLAARNAALDEHYAKEAEEYDDHECSCGH